MPTIDNPVKFKYGSQAAYDRIESPDIDSIYLTDAHRLFVGAEEYTRPVLTGTTEPTMACVPKSLYIRDVAASGAEGEEGYAPAHKEIWYNETGASLGWTQVVSEPLGTVRYDIIQNLTDAQKIRALTNIGAVSQTEFESHNHDERYYTQSQIDNMEFITPEDIDTICGGSLEYSGEVVVN